MRFATSLTLLALSTGTASAQAALDDEKKPANAPEPTTASTASTGSLETAPAKVEYGIDLRLRHVMVPNGLLELFVQRAAGGASNNGFGVDLVRRRGTLELQLGFEYEHIEVGEGVWINKGDNVAGGDESDYVLNPAHAGSKLGWFTTEFTFLQHSVINKYVAIRYGGGAGLGFITGKLMHYNVICNGATNDTVSPGCVPTIYGGTGSDSDGKNFGVPVKYDLPPVFPVVNAIIGVQVRPAPKAVINIEGGIRTIPFVGVSAGYFF
jgi:hypothetical protein